MSFLLSCLWLGACAGEKLQTPNIPENADPSVEISRLESDVELARKKQVDVLAPEHFKRSASDLKKAQELRSENKSNKDVLHEVAEGHAYLNRANQLASRSQPELQEVLEARNEALSAQAQEYFAKRFEETDEDLLAIAHDLEKGQEQVSPEDREKLVKQYKALKINGIRQASMGDSLKMIDEAKKEGADEWAPKSLKSAEDEASKLQSMILRNPNDSEQIAAAANNLRDQTELLLRVTRRSKVVDAKDSEDVALRLETQKNQLAQLQKERSAAEQNLESQKEQMTTLESETDFNDRFSKVRAKFSPDEATIVRSDHTILIRLKGLHFPPAGTNVASQDFSLLNKVGDALREFKDSQVIIEGHTDASGSRQSNQTVSEKRADAVKSYLVANNAVSEQKVKAEGKGFSSPISSNRTPEGRAQNRRVDIIIQAQA